MTAALVPLLAALLAAPITALVGLRRPRWTPAAAILTSSLAFAATLWGWLSGGGSLELPWAPTWNLNFSLTLDGLAALYGLLATGIALVVVIYSSGYLPQHLAHQSRPAGDQTSFYVLLLLFMGSMVGLVMARDLLLLFVFWDLTAIASYFLIGYDRQKVEARSSALMALLVTGVTSILFLIGALLLYAGYGTFSLPELIAHAEPGPLLTAAAALMAVAALAKSAQTPFHFWLPRAMVAPTPVSAYLHSAAMVAAGVFLLERIYPLLQRSGAVLDALLAIGLLSMAIGGVLALTQDILKQLLAYSTIAQYGYVVFLLGLATPTAVPGASFYVLAHALIKSSLFLAAGAVTMATGERDITLLGGLGRRMPLLAASSGVAAAALAGFPLTIGFFKDDLFFSAALERGWLFAALALMGTTLTFAYMWRFWSGIFLGPLRSRLRPIPATLVAPIAALALLILAGGFVVGPLAQLSQAAAAAAGSPATADLAYHLDPRPQNLLAVATYGLGILLVASRPLWGNLAAAAARLGRQVGPSRWYALTLQGLDSVSSTLHAREVRTLRARVAAVLVPTALLVGTGLLATPTWGAFTVEEISQDDQLLAMAVFFTALAALLTTLARDHLALVLLLSGVGYSLAVAYSFFGAPDVALLAVLIETSFTLLFLGILALLPRGETQRGRGSPAGAGTFVDTTRLPLFRGGRWRDLLLALLAGGFAFAVAWAILSQPAQESVAAAQIQLTPQAHAGDVVTAILADFRGLDTMGEVTVITIGLLGVITLLQRGRIQWRRR